MVSLGMLPRPIQCEQSETGLEAFVAAAIRLHERVETDLERLAAGAVPLPHGDEERDRQIFEGYLALYKRGVY